ncbi:adenylate/guanylate cyclase domain-containing protein [Bradyrhizobium algeriense]|uniref:adenylate/guanylate cyclase domain-containing protein n=1 Tax=Bradyrhizobium algeriense TaxID=634784 RepID=UPI000D3B03CA|nr:adenylate/guanylate cyclase domain-containing protein [Bradyrhizobium algeriense]
MTEQRVQRRLAAILAADVVGYSALMQRAEEATYAEFERLKREVIEPGLYRHDGRLIKTTGDGALAEFASPSAAVRCAVEIQESIASGRSSLKLRIGVNLGEVIVGADGDLFGDGINIAVRLEGAADPGGILISEKVYSEVEGKLDVDFEDRGEQQLKNISKPVRAFAVRAGAHSALIDRLSAAPGLPDKPSIAVLPFENMSGDPEQEYFADGVVEDIITALSRFSWLMVIARNSTFTYKNKATDVKQIGRELGVRYALEGSVRKAAGMVRITGQLIDCATGTHLWADRFDGSLENVFNLQDQVTANVVGAIQPRLRKAEIERANRKPTENLDAYDYFLRGLSRFHLHTRQGNEDALKLFMKVVDLDPNYAAAYGMAAYCRHRRRVWGWTDDRTGDLHELAHLTRQAAQLGKDDPVALSTAGWATAFDLRDPQLGAALIDRALDINPNEAMAWWMSAFARVWLGEPELAIAHAQRAVRLSPRDPLIHQMYTAIGNAHFVSGRYEEAAASALAALQVDPDYQPGLRLGAAACGKLGRIGEANRMIFHLRELFPDITLSALKDLLPYRSDHLAAHLDGLRKAGLPE